MPFIEKDWLILTLLYMTDLFLLFGDYSISELLFIYLKGREGRRGRRWEREIRNQREKEIVSHLLCHSPHACKNRSYT